MEGLEIHAYHELYDLTYFIDCAYMRTASQRQFLGT